MLVRAFFLMILCSLQTAGALSSARPLTLDEIVAKLQPAGYSQIRETPSGKIKSFRAVKNGKEVSIIIDSLGHAKELQWMANRRAMKASKPLSKFGEAVGSS